MAFNAGDIESTLTLDRSPFQRGLREARAEANAFEKKKIKATLDIDKRGIDQINKDMERLSRQRKGIQLHVDVDKDNIDEIKDTLGRIGDNTESTARRSGHRIGRALLSPIGIQLGLLPGLAAGAAVAGGAALGILAVGFGAIAAAAVSSNADVKQSYKDLWEFIKTDTKALAAPLAGTFQSITTDIRRSWNTLRPDLESLFADLDPLIQSVSSGILGFAEESIPRIENALALAGPTMRGFDQMLRSIGAGFGEMSENIASESIDMGDGLDYFGQFVRNLLSDLGRLVAMFSSAWAGIGPQFVSTFDRMVDAVLTFTQGGLTGLTSGLNLTLGVLNAVITVLGPFLGMFGGLTGYAIAASAAWKILSGSVGVFARVLNMIRPAEVAAGLAGFGRSMDNLGTKAGNATTKLTGSEAAGKRLASTTSRIGSAMVTAGSYLPLFGLAVGAVALAQQAATQEAEGWADALLKGGSAAVTAQLQIQGLRRVADEADQGFLGWINSITGVTDRLRGQADTAEESYRKQRDGLTAVELAQIRAQAAQAAYDTAVREHGINSFEAKNAQEALAVSTDAVEQAQHDAATAIQSTNDKLIAQTNLMLGAIGAQLNAEQSLTQVEQAQKNYNKAIEDHGKKSLEAKQAGLQYQQSLLSRVQAVGQAAAAEAEAKGVVDTATASNRAMRFEMVRLAIQAGTHMPASLQRMISSFSDSELAAYGVKRSVDKTGTSIKLLPGHKRITFPTDAPTTKGKVDALGRSVNSVPSTHYIDFYLRTIGSPPKAATGFGPGLGMLGTVPRRAKGGSVKANHPYWVGDGGGPELLFPNSDGFVLNSRDSAALAAGKGVTRGVRHLPLGGNGDGESMDTAAMAALAGMIGQAVAQQLSGAALRVQGSEWARLVNESNHRNDRR